MSVADPFEFDKASGPLTGSWGTGHHPGACHSSQQRCPFSSQSHSHVSFEQGGSQHTSVLLTSGIFVLSLCGSRCVRKQSHLERDIVTVLTCDDVFSGN